MWRDILTLAFMGGFISLLSTSFGSLLTIFTTQAAKLKNFKLSIDFAIGVMLSATAFALVGPEIMKAFHQNSHTHMQAAIGGLACGMIFIGFMSKMIQRLEVTKSLPYNHFVLALALVLHNFPEGMGAGASMVGMDLHDAIPLQIALSIQNIAEGLMLSLLLIGMGWSMKAAIFGGILSGIIEFSGAATAGVALIQNMELLAFFLSAAGGAMLMSVLIELYEKSVQRLQIRKLEILLGLLIIPLMNLILLPK